jgi:hypothetical protein
MAKRQRHTPEQVIGKLREAEVNLAKGTAITQVRPGARLARRALSQPRGTSSLRAGPNPRHPHMAGGLVQRGQVTGATCRR